MAKPDWRNGLRLEQRHFQVQDRYHEDLVRYSLRLALDDPWGVSQVSIDEDALASGQFVVRRLSALLPDGTPLVNATTIPPRAFDPRRRGTVYVALPMDLSGRPMVGPAAEGNRYAAEIGLVPDYNSGRAPVPMGWARPNARIVFEGESLDGMTALPIARLGDAGFIPPALRVSASPALQAVMERVATAARALANQPSRAAERSGGEAVRHLLGATLGRFLPALAASATAHPREAYRTVAAFVGALAAFTPGGAFTAPAFDFLDLKGSFEALEARAMEVLRALSAPGHRVVALTRADDHTYRAVLQEPTLLGKEFLLVFSGADPSTLHANVPRAVKVTSWEELGRAVEQHVAGVTLVSELRRPAGVQLPPQSACFRVDKRSPAWNGVVKHGTLAIWLPAGFTQLAPTLLAQEPSV